MSETANLLGDSLEEYRVEEPLDERKPTAGAKRLKRIDRSQVCWGAIDIEKLIEPDHPARGIWAMVMQLDLKELEEKIRSVEGRAGQSSYDPRMLMALWIYSYSEGIGSARELSRMCEYEPGCQWLTAMAEVNYHTLADFRSQHKKELDRIFTQVLGLLSAEGLIEMKRITQDGTKIKAHAASKSFHRRKRLREHLQMARKHVEAMSKPETADLTTRMIEARKRARRDKQQRLEEALQELQQLQQTRPDEEVRVSETDPQARVMKQADGGFAPSYNVQISTDAAHGIIVGVDVTQAGNDCDQLVDAVQRVKDNTGQTPQQVLVDGGYTMKNANIEAMAEQGIDLNGPVVENNPEASLRRRGIQPAFYPDKFRYDETTDTFRCPADKTLPRIDRHQREGRVEFSYRASATDCQSCPFQDQCCPKSSPRRVVRIEHCPAVQAFREKMATEEARKLYRTRAQIAEFPHAWLKEKLGLRQFRLRGRLKVGAEALWVCLTYNIQQWLRLIWRRSLLAAA
jgi:transposase